MKAAWTIGWSDFKTGFRSSRSFVVMFFFLIFMGAFFFNYVDTFFSIQRTAKEAGGVPPQLHQLTKALFEVVQFVLLLLIPAVTMVTFAEDRASGALRLFLVAPVSSFQLILGKFIGVTLTMGMTLGASLVFPAFLAVHGSPDWGMLAASYLGLFLLIASQLAFGIWVSALANSSFMAFVFTMFGLFLVLIMNLVAQGIKGSHDAYLAVRYLGYTDHLERFYMGLVSVADVTYFAAFTSLFLFFAVIALDGRRWR